MSIVASETEVQSAPPAKRKEEEKWEEIPIYMSGFERIVDEAVIDVMKMFTRSSKIKSVDIPSISDQTMSYKDALDKDPFNLRKMNNLAYHYLREGQHELGLNILIRGWKRAGEIPSEEVRFRFLMKAAELSYGIWKYKQALAVFRDITEPPADSKFRKSYLMLGTQVWSQNGDLQKGLKFFQESVDGESLQVATRVLAIVVLDLKKTGGFEAARSTIENLAGKNDHPDILMITDFAERCGQNRGMLTRGLHDQRNVMILAVGIFVVFFFCMLWYLEHKSLSKMSWKPPSK